MQTPSTDSEKILIFSSSTTVRKIIEYSLGGCEAQVEHGPSERIPDLKFKPVLIVFDGNLLSSSLGEDWEDFLLQAPCPLILLDGGVEPKANLLNLPTSRRSIIQKPFNREAFVHSVQRLGLSIFGKGALEMPAKKSEEIFDPSQGLPLQFEEQLRKEALAFVSDYCKSHFRSIAEEVLQKEIQRLTEERQNFLDEG